MSDSANFHIEDGRKIKRVFDEDVELVKEEEF